jgi:hypothetical protein
MIEEGHAVEPAGFGGLRAGDDLVETHAALRQVQKPFSHAKPSRRTPGNMVSARKPVSEF